MFKQLSFDSAVALFKQWGFEIEVGPRVGEVTLILDGPDFRTTTVYEASMLPDIAGAALEIRWRNGACVARPTQTQDATILAPGKKTVPLVHWGRVAIQH